MRRHSAPAPSGPCARPGPAFAARGAPSQPARQRQARAPEPRTGSEESRHRLQLTAPAIARRLIGMYSNPGEFVYDPFGGIGSTALCAVQADRRAYSSELNSASVADSLVYLRRHENRAAVPRLFDLTEPEVQFAVS